jgi:hypothetical protein
MSMWKRVVYCFVNTKSGDYKEKRHVTKGLKKLRKGKKQWRKWHLLLVRMQVGRYAEILEQSGMSTTRLRRISECVPIKISGLYKHRRSCRTTRCTSLCVFCFSPTWYIVLISYQQENIKYKKKWEEKDLGARQILFLLPVRLSSSSFPAALDITLLHPHAVIEIVSARRDGAGREEQEVDRRARRWRLGSGGVGVASRGRRWAIGDEHSHRLHYVCEWRLVLELLVEGYAGQAGKHRSSLQGPPTDCSVSPTPFSVFVGRPVRACRRSRPLASWVPRSFHMPLLQPTMHTSAWLH